MVCTNADRQSRCSGDPVCLFCVLTTLFGGAELSMTATEDGERTARDPGGSKMWWRHKVDKKYWTKVTKH